MTVTNVDITYWKGRKLTLIESLKDSSALQSEPKQSSQIMIPVFFVYEILKFNLLQFNPTKLNHNSAIYFFL